MYGFLHLETNHRVQHMFIFLILFTSLHALKGAPTPPGPLESELDFLLRNRDDASNDSRNLRSTYDILQSCLLTIFACVWTSGHPDIPGPQDAAWICLKRRLVTMSYSLIAPELMVYWALRQHIAAKRIADDYNTTIAKAILPRKSLWQSVKEWLTVLPETAAQRHNRQPWSKTHGFFVQMGGFLLYEHGRARRVLDYSNLKDLILEGKIDAPIVTEQDLQDRSKGDWLSKGFVVLQTTWFVIQCASRLHARLPLSELEVITLAFAVLNAFIYGVWWNKPQGVGVAIYVPLKEDLDVDTNKAQEKSVGTLVVPVDAQKLDGDATLDANLPDHDHIQPSRQQQGGVETKTDPESAQIGKEVLPGRSSQASIPEVENEPSLKKGWFRRQLEKDRELHSWPVFVFIRVPYRCLMVLVRPLSTLVSDGIISADALHVPMFYADEESHEGTYAEFTIYAIGALFGAIHLLSWTSDFPSRVEAILWHVSAVAITVEPVLYFFYAVVTNYEDTRVGEMLVFAFLAPSIAGLPIYVFARFTLVTLAFMSLRALPPRVFVVVPWPTFIPHL